MGCVPPPEEPGQNAPELSKDVIETRINDARVYEVPPESGPGEPISWSFDYDEPKEIAIVDQQQQGDRATIVLDIKTESAPEARIHRKLAGRIRTEWRLETTLAFRRWEIVNTENISMKYKDFPKAGQANTNANTRPNANVPLPPTIPN
jgi:hypothetical protein